jgi:hypothetical protein
MTKNRKNEEEIKKEVGKNKCKSLPFFPAIILKS